MKGFVPTPRALVDHMVEGLFAKRQPTPADVVLDPGCGNGEFIAGILRWCEAKRAATPTIVGVENDPRHWAPAHNRFLGNPSVKVRRRDFLGPDPTKYDFIVGNPPYVPITELTEEERERYRTSGYVTASGRMDLYLLYFEAADSRLAAGGRLVFVTPEKFLYVATAAPLRRLLAGLSVTRVQLLPEDTFPGLTTYPAVTIVDRLKASGPTEFILRDGRRKRSLLPTDGSSWLPASQGRAASRSGPTLDDVAVRISAGVATGADGVFVVRADEVDSDLSEFAHPTLSGRDLRPGQPMPRLSRSMLVPYSEDGSLHPPARAERLLHYLNESGRRSRLEARTCVRRKPWYAFHDSVPMPDLRRPKVVWKDISEQPEFWVDREGDLVPRHSVYYLVPRDPAKLDEIAEYLRSSEAEGWMRAHCQRAANGFLRLQSNVLRRLPIPASLVEV
jgi:adenine-specific DNA-methyltransferase